jgi:hypothetical protein
MKPPRSNRASLRRFSLLVPSPALYLLGLLGLTTPANAGTELDFWHSYTHQPSGVTHYAFHLVSYKSGLFFGSCGLSTKSLRWEYNVDLTGNGPVYQQAQIAVTADGKRLAVGSGTITIDAQGQKAAIDLQIQRDAGMAAFVGNGKWRIKKLR